MSADLYVWIPNWGKFQHYKDRNPPWIKNHVALLSHDAYTNLSGHRRAILHGTWMEYASSSQRLRGDTVTLTRRLNLKVSTADVKALVDAGFIELLASTALAERLQSDSILQAECYPSRASAPSQEAEGSETDPLNPPHSGGLGSRANGTNPRAKAAATEAAREADKRDQVIRDFIRRCRAEDWPAPSLVEELVDRFHLERHQAVDLIEAA